MKLKTIYVFPAELQIYLDKYQDKIKFIFTNCQQRGKFLLIIDGL